MSIPIRRRVFIGLASVCLFTAAPAGAQGVCLSPLPESPPETIAPVSSEFLEIQAGDAGGRLGDGTFELSEGVVIRYRGNEILSGRAQSANLNATIEVLDDVSIRGEGFEVFAEEAQLDRRTGTVTSTGARLNLTEGSARATATSIVADPDNHLISLAGIMFTTCPEDDLDWELLGRGLDIDTDAGFGRARGVRLKFKGVPILWAPVFSFPIDDQRKSGFLAPEISKRDRTGFDLTVPYYLNLAPNYDLLLEPRYMDERGLQINSRFRYLMPGSEGQLSLERLDKDDQLGIARHYVHLEHETRFGGRWLLETFIDDVSDPAYFEDMGDSLGVISQTHLDRYVDLAYFGPRWQIVSRIQAYQTIDDLIAEIDQPYQRRPQMLFEGRWGDRIVGFDSTIEAVDFERDVGVTGRRLDSTQELSLRFARAGMYLTPAIAMRQTSYRVDDAAPGVDRSPSRGLPVTSLDSGMRFERDAGETRSWIQTIEPRVLYIRIPYEDQSDLPIFDTVLPDFNLVQLFSKYRFVGGDRVADTDRVSVGVTTRLIESASGRERASATIGQTRFREPRRVMLPDEPDIDSKRSNYVAELAVTLSDKWNLDVGYQWNGETEETVRAETRFEFRPERDRLFGVGYRLRKDVLEQGDLSMIWPLGQRWRVIGQYSYSVLEQKPLERFAGLEYEACCWRLRVTSRRYIIRSTGETDDSVSIQLELKGLSQRSATPEELLGRGILGTRPLDTDSG